MKNTKITLTIILITISLTIFGGQKEIVNKIWIHDLTGTTNCDLKNKPMIVGNFMYIDGNHSSFKTITNQEYQGHPVYEFSLMIIPGTSSQITWVAVAKLYQIKSNEIIKESFSTVELKYTLDKGKLTINYPEYSFVYYECNKDNLEIDKIIKVIKNAGIEKAGESKISLTIE